MPLALVPAAAPTNCTDGIPRLLISSRSLFSSQALLPRSLPGRARRPGRPCLQKQQLASTLAPPWAGPRPVPSTYLRALGRDLARPSCFRLPGADDEQQVAPFNGRELWYGQPFDYPAERGRDRGLHFHRLYGGDGLAWLDVVSRVNGQRAQPLRTEQPRGPGCRAAPVRRGGECPALTGRGP